LITPHGPGKIENLLFLPSLKVSPARLVPWISSHPA
jgi:hypothetical protein